MGEGQEQGRHYQAPPPMHHTVILEGSVCEWHRGCACGTPILRREAWLKRVEPGLRVDVLPPDRFPHARQS